MNKQINFFLFLALLLILASCNQTNIPSPIGEHISNTPQYTTEADKLTAESYKVCSFNAQIFGKTKVKDEVFMNELKDKIRFCDTFFLLEIRDISGEVFKELCEQMSDYECSISQADGRSTSKEQIGILTKNKGISATSTLMDKYDVWERSPVLFQQTMEDEVYNGTKKDTNWNYYVVHLKPDDVKNEIKELEKKVFYNSTNPSVIIGDLNADCDYYDSQEEKEFDDWFWLIKYDEDTTTNKNTHCAYDRILLNREAYLRYVAHGIDATSENVSDHDMIWMGINR